MFDRWWSELKARVAALGQRPFLRRTLPHLIERAGTYWELMRFHRPIGTLLLLCLLLGALPVNLCAMFA